MHAPSTELKAWLQSLKKFNAMPIIRELDIVRGDRKTAEAKERQYIYHYTALGYDLLNNKHLNSNKVLFIEHLQEYEQRQYRTMKSTL